MRCGSLIRLTENHDRHEPAIGGDVERRQDVLGNPTRNCDIAGAKTPVGGSQQQILDARTHGETRVEVVDVVLRNAWSRDPDNDGSSAEVGVEVSCMLDSFFAKDIQVLFEILRRTRHDLADTIA